MAERGTGASWRRSPFALRQRPDWTDLRRGPARLSPARLALLVFTALIAIVTALLSLPVAASGGTPTSFVDALFTAVSAICVTGLVTVDTAVHWSPFGLTVIMLAKIGRASCRERGWVWAGCR